MAACPRDGAGQGGRIHAQIRDAAYEDTIKAVSNDTFDWGLGDIKGFAPPVTRTCTCSSGTDGGNGAPPAQPGCQHAAGGRAQARPARSMISVLSSTRVGTTASGFSAGLPTTWPSALNRDP